MENRKKKEKRIRKKGNKKRRKENIPDFLPGRCRDAVRAAYEIPYMQVGHAWT